VYYIPPDDIRTDSVIRVSRTSFCEWKGEATYCDVVVGNRRAERAAWGYLHPTEGFLAIKGYIAFYASLMESCLVNGERVQPQSGDFYGGWITSDIVGPFKGPAGTWYW
jgi:uncharacterized protein (DUF427 family)